MAQAASRGGLTMAMIDATKWEEFYKKMTDGLKPYDHYDDGYRDAMDNVDDWMDGNQVEADPVWHGYLENANGRPKTYIRKCSVCGKEPISAVEGAVISSAQTAEQI